MILIQKLLAIAQVAGSVVLYLLLGLSVLSIGMIIERWWFFRRRRIDNDALGREVLKRLDSGDQAGVNTLLASSRSVEAEVLGAAMKWYEAGPESFQEVLTGTMRQARKKLEGGLLFLGTLGNNAPFIGLFGTVLGIVTAFRELGAGAGATSGAMGNVMSAIAEALVATAVGILVALPAVIAYNTFQKKAGQIEDNVGTLGNLVVAQMKATDGRKNHTTNRRERELRSVGPEAEA
jgi:biopolymer transport protein ExbB/biopolymer transport protein TolQ